jgi:hypothetical protein
MNSKCTSTHRSTSCGSEKKDPPKKSRDGRSFIEALETRIAPATLFGLDDNSHLIRFDSVAPGLADAPISITGLAAGEQLHAVDFRPATGHLYALGIVEGAGVNDAAGRIYTINTTTGAATQVGAAPFSTTLADDADYGFDFNPTVDRIRIVNSADQNLRVNPDTGALAATDTALDNSAASEEIVGSAYDRSNGGPALTTLYGIDFANNTLVRQGGVDGSPSPNGGSITTIGALGVFLGTPEVGFDIATGTSTGFATFTVGGVTGPTGLYSIDLVTGAATLVGNVGTGATSLRGLAAVSTSLVVAGTAGADSLVVTATGTDSGSYSLNGGAAVPFTGISEFTFDGGAGADTLTINNPAGTNLFAPTGGINFNGQDPTSDPGDTLVLNGGGGPAFSEIYAPGATLGSGLILTGNGSTFQAINFTGVESVTDTSLVSTFEINLTAGTDLANITSGPLIGTDQTLTISGGAFGAVTFAHKAAVSVYGLGGADTINVNETAATTGLTSLTLFGHDAAGAADDNASDTFAITATKSATSVKAGGGNDLITFANAATLSGGTIDGGAGTDTVDYSSYTTGVAVNLGSAPTTLIGSLTPDQEVPPNGTTPTGTATLTYNVATKTFTIDVSVTGMIPAAVSGFHIHNAAFGTNGPIIVDFVPGGTPIAPLVPTPDGFTFSATNVSLPALNEAALLGGVTYVNIHAAPNFPAGQIRGQLFASAAFTATGGTGTGTAGISGVENAIGGTGNDSLVGNLGANQLTGLAGNDTIVGAPGSDTLAGGDANDVIAWNNGDGTDVMDGGDGTDIVQVNGAVSGDDVFTIGAGLAGRVDFDRTSLVPFSLDIGTVESLVVNGVGGSDTMIVNDLTSVSNLATLSLNGQDGNDTFNLGVIPGSTLPAGITLNINGGASGGASRDIVNLDVAGPRSVAMTYQEGATGGVILTGLGSIVNITSTESVNYNGDGANDDAVTVVGTQIADIISVRPTSASSAEVFIGGKAPAAPGVAGGGLSPDLILSGLGSPLNIDGSTPSTDTPLGDRLAYLGSGTLDSPGTGSGTVNSNAGFIPVHFSSIEMITGLTPVLNGGQQAFSSPTSYEAGTTPRGIATGDVNNDGFVDMIVASAASNSISILLGTGDGTFLPATSRTSGGVKPVALTLGDFNGDLNLDIAVVNRGSDAVTILTGTGAGTFTTGASIPVAVGANAIQAGNLDADGDLDIAVTSATSNRVNILLNNGNATFGTPAQVATRGQAPRDLVIGDFNSDGSADLAIANSATDTVAVLIGSAAGIFEPVAKYKVGDSPTSLTAADFNGDGIIDIAASHSISRFVSVLLGTGFATGSHFDRQLRIAYGATIAPAAIESGDFNGDGVADIALAGGKAGSFTIALGIGNGTFGPATTFPIFSEPAPNSVALALADFDGNGSLDVAVANVGSNDIAVALRVVV